MGKYFGTDGVRGVAGADLTCELAMKIGRGAATVLTDSTSHRPRILIGKDTRISGDMLEAALSAGLCSVGADVESRGRAAHPRCGLSGAQVQCRRRRGHLGVPQPDGVQRHQDFAGNGYKLPDEVENEGSRSTLTTTARALS